MKRFNLLALVVFVSVNVFTPISYAWEIFGGKPEILENVIENAVDWNNDIVWWNEVPEDEDFKFSNLWHLDSPVESPEKHEVTDEDGLEGFSDDVNSGGFGDDVNSGGFNDDVSSEEFNDDVKSEGLDIIEENLSKEWELVMQDDNIGNNASGSYDLTTFQKAFQEVAYAYYMRGSYLHYNVAKGIGNILSPEQSTSQDYHHMACALYVMNVLALVEQDTL